MSAAGDGDEESGGGRAGGGGSGESESESGGGESDHGLARTVFVSKARQWAGEKAVVLAAGASVSDKYQQLGEQHTFPSHPPESDSESESGTTAASESGSESAELVELPGTVLKRFDTFGQIPLPGAPPRIEGGAARAPESALVTLDSRSDGAEGGGPVGPGRVLDGKYSLARLLGSGGMGQIYEAEHVVLGIPVAIKTMHPHVASIPESRRRFFHEARAASLLKHPNVVQVLDFGEESGLLYLVMERLQGQTLAARLRSLRAPPELSLVEAVLCGILDATAAAHARGIVHRDLKPDNVFLTEWEGKQGVKVVDFGLAHYDDQLDPGPTLTAHDMIAGTPEYMSPEQCRSLAVGPSTDLYAIGCILTVMLQGAPPFSGLAPVEILAKHMFSLPPPLVRPAGSPPVPPLLERLRMDLLAKVPERRPASAVATRARLIEALSPEGESRRLPARKGDVLVGDRRARAPSWAEEGALGERAGGAEPQGGPQPDRLSGAPGSGASIALLRLVPAAEGVNEACATGLDAEGVRLVEVADAAALARSGLGVVVIDAGAGVEAACAVLGAIAVAAPGVRAIVCASGLGAERMNALVAAGAADVARTPVTPDVLARKIGRVLRRGR